MNNDKTPSAPGESSSPGIPSLSRPMGIQEALRKLLRQIQSESLLQQYQRLFEQGDSTELKNELPALRRVIELDIKRRRVSSATAALAERWLRSIPALVQSKTKVEQLRHALEPYQSEENRRQLGPAQKDELRRLAAEMRASLEQYRTARDNTLELFRRTSIQRQAELSEEAALRQSIESYLTLVDQSQRGKLETQMRSALQNTSYEQRVAVCKNFIDRLIRISPSIREKETERLLEFARYCLADGRIDHAIRELKEALALRETVELYQTIAHCWSLQGEPDREIESLESALRLDRNNVDLLVLLAGAYEKTGRIPRAVEWYKQAVRIKPDRLPLVNHAAVLAYEHRLWPEAVSLLANVLEQKPKSIKTMKRLGIALIQAGHPDRGVPLLNQCGRFEGFDPELCYFLGSGYTRLGRLHDAESMLEQAVSSQPDNREWMLELASVQFRRGKYEETLDRCRGCLQKQNNDPAAALWLAKACNQLNRCEEAMQVLQPYILNDPPARDLGLEYAKACLGLRSGEQAYTCLQSLRAAYPGDPEIDHQLSLACILSGRFDESLQYLPRQENL